MSGNLCTAQTWGLCRWERDRRDPGGPGALLEPAEHPGVSGVVCLGKVISREKLGEKLVSITWKTPCFPWTISQRVRNVDPEKMYLGELLVIPDRFDFSRVNRGFLRFVIFTHGRNFSLHLSTN